MFSFVRFRGGLDHVMMHKALDPVNFMQQLIQGKWLINKAVALIAQGIQDEIPLPVSRHQNDRQGAMFPADILKKRYAVHFRHGIIGDNQINFTGVIFNQVQGLVAAQRMEYMVPPAAQSDAEIFDLNDFVINYQHIH